MLKKSAAIITNSKECTRHIQYYATIENYLKINDYEVKDDFEVDKVLICACGFHDFMFGKVQKTLETLKGIAFPTQRIFLLGCLPKTHRKSIAQVFEGPVIPFGEEQKLDDLLAVDVPFSQIQPSSVFRIVPGEPQTQLYYIKIAQGCFRECTFCVINKAKGALHSESAATIQASFKSGLQKGYRHFFLMGEDTFAYGLDAGTSIIELTRSLIELDPNVKFSFGSLHIKWLSSYADDILTLCQSGHVEHLHIGLQHVDDGILKRMGRPVQFKRIYEDIRRIKFQCPQVIFSADVMVGFPGESEEAFNGLISFFESDTCFDQISHFGYSDVKGAASSRLAKKVDALQIAFRWEKLRQVLGPRSYYNRSERSIDQRNRRYREAFIATFEKDFAFCINSNTE